MKKLLFLLSILSVSANSYSQMRQKDILKEAKQLLECMDTTGNSSLRQQAMQSLQSMSSHGYSESHIEEALKAGYGTSRWDKGGFYPGMDLEKHRSINRRAWWMHTLKIAGICVASIILVFVVYLAVKRIKEKESSKELLIYIRKSHHSYNTESSDSDQ